jgi:hypothetical protein
MSSVESQDSTKPSLIGIEATMPESVFKAVSGYLEGDRTLTWDRVMTQACSLWLLQQGAGGKEINQAYLGAVFNT